MRITKLSGAMAAALAVCGCLALAPAAHAGKSSTFLQSRGAGGSLGGVNEPIPDGAGQLTQLVRSGIPVKGLNPKGKITDVNVSVRASHPFAADLEMYLATPRGVINLTSDNGGTGNNYGSGPASCASTLTTFDSNVPTLISTPGLAAPFAGTFAPEEPLTLLNGLGGKKATNSKWSLLVEDDSAEHPAGTLDCWSLKITATNPGKKKK